MKTTPAQRDEAIERLRELFANTREVYINQRSVSRSGMSRRVTVHVVATSWDGSYTEIRDITVLVGRATGFPMFPIVEDPYRFELRVQGAGMDMHFHVAYVLGRTLWPDGLPGTAVTNGGYVLTHRTL